MKLIYISNTRLPSEKANSYQTMQMCNSFSKFFDEVELWTGKARNTPELQDIKDIFGFYNIKKTFSINTLWQPDSLIIAKISEFVWSNSRDILFSVNACFKLTKLRKSKKVIIYTRVWSFLYVYQIFKKLGLVHFRLFYESHKFSNFLIKPISKIDGLVVINNYLFNLYKEKGIKKLIVAHDGVSIDEYSKISDYQFQSKKNEINVVYTGSLFLWKGVYTLIDSIQYLPKNYKLIIIGGSSQYMIDFKKYVERNIQDGRVKVVPHIPKKDLLSFIEIADVLVLPNSSKDKMSLYTSPIKMFEYMASKRPIVASRLASIKEILSDKENAILFDPDDAQDLASKIEYTVNFDCKRIVENAYDDVKKHTWDLRAHQINKFTELEEHI